jgi:TolB-like protein
VGQRLVEVQTETAKAPTTREIDPHSIAVLPLENLSPNPDDAYFAAGVHDALITSLSKITALMVTSGTSSRRVNSRLSVPEIGRQLGVSKLLEGSVLMDGDRVRVIVQLIDSASDLHLWAETNGRPAAAGARGGTGSSRPSHGGLWNLIGSHKESLLAEYGLSRIVQEAHAVAD